MTLPLSKSRQFFVAIISAVLLFASSSAYSLDRDISTIDLRRAVTVENARFHQLVFQAIANINNGTRASGTMGYDESAEYVAFLMELAGYEVTVQPFSFDRFSEVTESELSQASPAATDYTYLTDFFTMTYSGSGDTTAAVTAVDLDFGPAGDGIDNTSTSGCEPADFAGFPAGDIALVQRGACSFQQKAVNAEAAGASAVIIFNQGNLDERKVLFGGTLGADYPGTLPVVSATFDNGKAWADTAGLNLRIFTDTLAETVETTNVIADTPGGREDHVIVVGAHLDSVDEGPGIQDNGSGSGGILEVALQMANLDYLNPRNKVRFAWWGGEEAGLLGSTYYVNTLDQAEQNNIALNLNFDMIASPNFVRFIYDGDGSDTAVKGPSGSARIEKLFQNFFRFSRLASEPTEFSGRSDYGPFIAVGIPAGGLFTGAEGIKTADQAVTYGGTAGEQYDPCYHLACDTYDNVSVEVFDQNIDAIAFAVRKYSMTQSKFKRNKPAPGAAEGLSATSAASNNGAVTDLEYLGSLLQR